MNCKNWRIHKTSRLKTTSSQSPKNWFVEWSHHRATCLCVLPSQFRTHHCALIAKLIASHQIECLRSCVRAKEHVIFCTCAGCRVQSTARKDVEVKAGRGVSLCRAQVARPACCWRWTSSRSWPRRTPATQWTEVSWACSKNAKTINQGTGCREKQGTQIWALRCLAWKFQALLSPHSFIKSCHLMHDV